MTDRSRRPRGTAKGNPSIFGQVAPGAKDVLTRMSLQLHISEAASLEALLLALPIDPDGVPACIDRSRFAGEGQRRPRGTAKGNPHVNATVSQDAKAVLVQGSKALNNISQSRVLEEILLGVPRDADGVPSCVDRARFDRQELPIPAA